MIKSYKQKKEMCAKDRRAGVGAEGSKSVLFEMQQTPLQALIGYNGVQLSHVNSNI